MRCARGPLVMLSLPNTLGHARIGTSISRRVGNSVVRHRIKRLIKEAFRLQQHDAGAFDLLILVRPHEPMTLEQYRPLVRSMIERSKSAWLAREEAS